MKIGYARVSTLDQSLDLQRDALEAAGCGKVIIVRSAARWPKGQLWRRLKNY